LRFAGATVILLGIFSFQSGLVLTQTSANSGSFIASPKPISQPNDQAAPELADKQVVTMKIVGLEYLPNRFTVKQGVPVEWRINAEAAQGCGRVLIVPKLRIQKLLLPFGTNFVRFTPQEPGEIAFNCGMGMMTPGSKFTVVVDAMGERL
jgi:plastocyanin domain-containing protein